MIENEIAHSTGIKAPNRENEAIFELSMKSLVKDFKN